MPPDGLMAWEPRLMMMMMMMVSCSFTAVGPLKKLSLPRVVTYEGFETTQKLEKDFGNTMGNDGRETDT